ncbi:STAS domain-containing protein [Planococcus salinus]|uniref:STAS domain-containing protein n=1 Tax=Planococcus salinus TaxID=1848460 RepID=A0A3M8P6F0_9BACL|nr:STAS domain-containing protein [Planococcus salinus]RNF38784.1 STAS domain-containing protein [Planococcus salinus]
MGSFERFSQYITENTEALANEVVEKVLAALQLDIPEQEEGQAIAMYIGLLEFFADSLKEGGCEAVPEALIEWSKKNAEVQVATDGRISEIVRRYPPTREVFNDLFTAISLELDLSLKDHAFLMKRINAILDISLNETFFAFERLSEKIQAETENELVKLSAPIVPVKDDIVILPLIGFIDSDRLEHIKGSVIPKIAEKRVDHVITDFSGIMTIDMQTAEAMHQIGSMLRVMGIHLVVAGLRPDLVQAIVSSGIDMSRTEAYATVKQALESIR